MPPSSWVDQLLDRLQLTTTELAQLAGVARSTPGRWRRGERPRPAVVGRLATLCGVTVEELAGAVYGGATPREFGAAGGLAQARRAAGLDTSSLARRLHVSVSTVSHWESGRRRPDPAVWTALAAALGVTHAELEGLTPIASRRLVGPVPALRELRISLGLSQGELGSRLAASATTVSHWERATRPFRWDRLEALRSLTGIPTERLVELLRRTPDSTTRVALTPLELLRRERSLSVEDAARRIQVSRHRLRRWERGEQPPLWAARALAQTYGVGLRRVCLLTGLTPPELLDPRTWTPDRLPEVLRTLQDWSGCPVARLAGAAGVSPSTVRRWHTGATLPSAARLDAVERLYGLGRGELRRLRVAG